MEAKHELDPILPVIDLKRGQVVHAVAGDRDRYAPLQSQIVDSIHPGRVAKALCEQVATRDVYVADLDAIAGDEPDRNSCDAIERTGAKVWLDAGIQSPASAQRLLRSLPRLHRMIIGLETLATLRHVEEIRKAVPSDRLVFSLDLRKGLPQTADRAAKRMSAESIAAYVIDEGIQSIIVLDLIAVGTQTGGSSTLDLCRNIRSRYLDIELIAGGGVRDIDDVRRFTESGCDRVLVATALHQGALGQQQSTD